MIGNPKSIGFKLNKYIDKDYLFWIYPLIILGLIIFAANRNNHYRESVVSTDAILNADSSVTMNIQNRKVDGLKMTEYNDNTLIFYATTK
jgi:hypothetical protein